MAHVLDNMQYLVQYILGEKNIKMWQVEIYTLHN